MKSFLFILLSGILLVTSCNENNPGNPSKIAGASTSPSSSSIEKKKMQVVFFTLSSNELAAMEQQGGDIEGIMSGIDEFEFNVEKFMDSTGIPGLQVRLSDAPVIQLTMNNGEIFTLKRDKDNVYGGIFFDGVQPPKITQGLYLDFEYRDIARSYFGIQ